MHIKIGDSWPIAALGILFIALKLCHVINWSWWFVTLPFWFALPLIGIYLMVVGIVLCTAWVVLSLRQLCRR